MSARTTRTQPHRPMAAPLASGQGMHRHLLLSLVCATLYAGTTPPVDAAGTTNGWAPGRLLVQTRPGLPAAELNKILKPHGGKAIGRIQGIDVHVVQLPAHASEKAVAALLARNKHLQFAELDRVVAPAATANDTYYSKAWHLPKIGAPTAWDSSKGDGVTIAILDTGINGNHTDLKDRMVAGWNFYDNNADTSDVHGHGTAVAGAAAATTNNGTGVAAVAGNARLMPVRIADPNAYAYWSTVAQGLTWAADNGADVANISYNGVSGSSTIQNAAQYMKNKGGLVVVAAGNNGIDENIAASDTLISVSATDGNDLKTSWSSYGGFIDVAAPGVTIYTTDRGGGYQIAQGTSLASPVVAGVVGLMMAANPDLGPADIEQLLFASAKDLGTSGFDTYYGHGRVDAALAVQAALAAVPRDATAPGVSVTNPSGGTTLQGTVTVDVAASDNVAVARVDLVVNGTQVASDSSAPYGFSWDSTQASDGAADIVAYAYDGAGNVASHGISVNIANNVSVDGIAPVATISNPVDGSTLKGSNITVKASATDNKQVTSVVLYIDGMKVRSSTSSSLSYNWNLKYVAKGPHSIKVEAKDAAGNLGTHSISVTR